MSNDPVAKGSHKYQNIQIGGQARVLLGNCSGQGSNITGRADFTGQYAHSSLRPVANYVPRLALQQKLRDQLPAIADPTDDESRTVVVWGLGGSGKSQLVLDYTRQNRRDYGAVFWVEAGQKETIERDYVQIHRLLFPEAATGGSSITVKDAVPAVKSWFHQQKGRSLLIVDSADSIDNMEDVSYIDLNYYLPDATGVDIIVTTRSSQAQEISSLEAVEVGEMMKEEAVQLFHACAKLPQPSGGGVDMEQEILAIVKELGYLALATMLAGSYVAATPRLSSDLRRYLPEYRQHRKRLLSRKAIQNVHRYGESVLGTWETTFAAVERQSAVASRLLGLLAFMNFDDIFPRLFDVKSSAEGAIDCSHCQESLQWLTLLSPETIIDQYTVESGFATLQAYSLVSWRTDQGAYTMHKLVHAWGHDRLQLEQQQEWSLAALELLSVVVKECRGDLATETRLVPHVMAAFTATSMACRSPYSLGDRDRSSVDIVGGLFKRLGQWGYEHDVRIFQAKVTAQVLGEGHPDTLKSMNDLAIVLSFRGKYKQAEEIFQQMLKLYETVLGKEHFATLMSMNNLAAVLNQQGKFKQAEKIHQQTLLLRKTVLRKEHSDIMTSMNNLATVLNNQRKYKQAEEMHQQTLLLRKTVLGKEHPDTLTSINDLAIVLNQ